NGSDPLSRGPPRGRAREGASRLLRLLPLLALLTRLRHLGGLALAALARHRLDGVFRGRGAGGDDVLGVAVLDDRQGDPGLAEQVARAGDAHRLLVALDLLLQLLHAGRAILGSEA